MVKLFELGKGERMRRNSLYQKTDYLRIPASVVAW